jgi:Heparinase II/III-like protein/Heparinase II/III N-terminus
MSQQELSYRAAEVCRIYGDRLRWLRGRAPERDDELCNFLDAFSGSFKDYLWNVAANRFYTSVGPRQRTALTETLLHAIPESVDRAVEEAERLLAHRVNLLGFRDVPLGDEIDWHRDPVTGHQWRKCFWADYDLVHGSPSDPKVIHELNRHQHLPRLAKAFMLTADERFAQEAVCQMETWIDQNPTWYGVNWQSSLELAIRTSSWLWTLFMLLPSNALNEDVARRIATSLLLQIDRIHRFPSTYSSPNTHLIGEAVSLFTAGLLFTELPKAAAWRDKGLSILMNEMKRQVLSDGVYFELSPYYHCYAADFLMQALVLARIHRVAMPEWTWNRLGRMLDFVMHVTRPDGTIPLLGDDDGGRALALSSEGYRSYRDGLCSAAVLYNRPDFKFAAGRFAEETLWLLGESAFPIYEAIPGQAPSRLHYSCADAGYFIQRTGWSAEASHLVFDSGGHGSPSGGHAHADALSICLFGAGAELLVDSGTAIYNTARDWRKYFRSTRSHNTIVVDGLDQSSQADTFSWENRARVSVLRHFATSGLEYVDGEHDGYMRLRQPVMHRRRVLHVQPHYWVIFDELCGRGEHTIDFVYHFAPEARLFVVGEEETGEVECHASLKDSGLHMGIYATAPMRAEAICGQTEPIQGWTSTRYGEWKPAPVFKGSIQGAAPVTAMTFLMPGADKCLRTRRLQASRDRALAVVVRDGEFEDLCVIAMVPSAEFRLMNFSMGGELFWIRTENGVLRQWLAINASSFSHGGQVLFREEAPVSHVMAHLWENGMVIERGGEEGTVYVRDFRDRQFQRS